jgi:hypothetical protein
VAQMVFAKHPMGSTHSLRIDGGRVEDCSRASSSLLDENDKRSDRTIEHGCEPVERHRVSLGIC